jgi:membrane protein
VLAVVLLLASLYAQVAITTAQVIIAEHVHRHLDAIVPLRLSRIVPAAVLFAAIYLLFFALTPQQDRRGSGPRWPGALLVTVWWGLVSIVLPVLFRRVFTYDLTYGSLAGVMIALFFFWLVGLGVVTGAELNAAIAMVGARDGIGQAEDPLQDQPDDRQGKE